MQASFPLHSFVVPQLIWSNSCKKVVALLRWFARFLPQIFVRVDFCNDVGVGGELGEEFGAEDYERVAVVAVCVVEVCGALARAFVCFINTA